MTGSERSKQWIESAGWLLGLGSVVAAFSCVQPATAADAPRPNVVFLLSDDQGWGDVGWHDGGPIQTPNLDRLAAAGARLEQFYVQPVCSPTRASLMTGRYPIRMGLQVGVIRPWAEYGLSLQERLLPQALKEAGYETAIVGKWHLGLIERAYLPTNRGFDHQYGHYNGAIDYFTHIRDGGFDWHKDDQVNRDEGYSTTLIGQEAARLIRERDKSKPLFLYVPFNAVHTPHQVPEEYKAPYAELPEPRRTYAGMLAAMDEAIGVIDQAIEDEGMRESTLIIFSSDNGGPSPGRVTSNGPLRAGKGTVYEGGVRVCAFATWPGAIPAGSEVKAMTHMVDWYPTLLGLAGASLEQPLPLDGRDAWMAISQGAPSPRDEILHNATPNGGAIRVGDWKLVVGQVSVGDDEEAEKPAPSKKAQAKKADREQEESAARERVELYNIAEDPHEKSNLADEKPEIVKRLRARYDELAAEALPPLSAPKAPGFQSPAVWGE